MVYINEWLPNPVGNDTKGEFVEIFNSEDTAVSLNGWSLWTGGKTKKSGLSGFSIMPHGYLVLGKSKTKLSFKNTDGALWLYGPDSAVRDYGAFVGAAPEGESFSRIDHDPFNAQNGIQHFAFVVPTPGAANKTINNEVAIHTYPKGVALDPPLGALSSIGLAIGMAFILVIIWLYIFYKHENISKLIFEGDASFW